MTWKELYIEYNQDVYNYILLMVGNKETAEDITTMAQESPFIH
ncbi:hypothetical protein QA612_14210 [Evansella sp. AB-P1]|nr:hypothetical protein [Evansella sp. AB-P1]MDG5788632.1 hypothetical protein [Evansella sp. AB-P1]